MRLKRRDFLSFAGLSCAGFMLDPTRLLWRPQTILEACQEAEALAIEMHVMEAQVAPVTMDVFGSHDGDLWTKLASLPVHGSDKDTDPDEVAAWPLNQSLDGHYVVHLPAEMTKAHRYLRASGGRMFHPLDSVVVAK